MINREPRAYDFSRYLEAKRTVDDRALNRGCRDRLREELDALPRARPLRVLEVGAGLGAMLERLVEWGLDRDFEYAALDSDSSLLTGASRCLSSWASLRNRSTEMTEGGELLLSGARQKIKVKFLAEDLFDIGWRKNRTWDLILANSFLDLVNLEATLDLLLPLLPPGGIFYFTLVFDGATILRPILDPQFDALVEDCYHSSMEGTRTRRNSAGHSRTGRMLLESLCARNERIIFAGGSDWVVYPPYRADEAYFLHHILYFMEGALKNFPELNPKRLADWLETRHRQIEEEGLIYIAHQLDVLGGRPS